MKNLEVNLIMNNALVISFYSIKFSYFIKKIISTYNTIGNFLLSQYKYVCTVIKRLHRHVYYIILWILKALQCGDITIVI